MKNDRSGWTEYRGGPNRTPYRSEGVPIVDPVTADWAIGVQNAQILSGGVLVSDGRVSIARTDGISILDIEAGREAWKKTTVRPMAMAADDSMLFVATDTAVLAFDLQDGRQQWKKYVSINIGSESPVSGPEYHPERLALCEKGLCVGTATGVTLLDRDTGAVIWRSKRSDEVFDLAVGASRILAFVESGLIGIDSRSGDEKWKKGQPPECQYQHLLGVTGSEAVMEMVWDDAVFGNHVLAERIDIRDGSKVGEIDVQYGFPQLVTEDVCYVDVFDEKKLSKYAIMDRTVEWERSVNRTGDLTLVGDVLYVPISGGVVGLNTVSGEQEMRYGGIGSIRHVLFSNESLLVASDTELSRLSETKRKETRIY